MFKKLCKYLEKFQCSRLCDSNNFWISSPISNKTTLNKSRSAVKICNAPQHRNVKADQKVKRAKDTCSCTTKPKLRESNVFSSQDRLQQTPDIQLTESESVFTSVQVQTNQYVPRPRFFTTRRLGYKNRSQAGLFPYTSGSVTPAISKSPVQDRHDSSVSAHDSSVSARNSRAASSNESTLRAVIGTQGIRHSFKLGCSANAKSRTQSGSLLGRLSHSPSRTPNSYRACRRGGPNIDDTGFHHKLRKVCSHSIQDSRVLRSNMESRHEFQVPSQRQAEENSDQDTVNRSLLLLESERCSVRSRHVEFCIVCRPSRAASLPPLANGLRSPSQEQAIHKTLFRSNSFGGTGMVDTSTLCQQKYTDTPITMYTLPDDRRICHRVGSGTRRYSPKRYLGSKSDFLAQQCQGDVGYNPGHSGAKTSPFQFNCTDTVRQQERRELHQEPGRPALQSPISNNKHVVSRNGRTQYRMIPQYIPGQLNTEADLLSRQKTQTEWYLTEEACREIFDRFGTPVIDLFASRTAHILTRYVSRDCRDLNAEFHNAFSRRWQFPLAWVFPPPHLVPRVLAHLNSAVGMYILIVPRWHKVYWRPDVKRRAVRAPFTITNLRHRLLDTRTCRPPPQVDQICLEAWLVKGGHNS